MNDEQILKPCPFCGGDAYIEQRGTPRQSCIVECGSCGLRHDSGDEGNRCGTSWNRRAIAASASAEPIYQVRKVGQLKWQDMQAISMSMYAGNDDYQTRTVYAAPRPIEAPDPLSDEGQKELYERSPIEAPDNDQILKALLKRAWAKPLPNGTYEAIKTLVKEMAGRDFDAPPIEGPDNSQPVIADTALPDERIDWLANAHCPGGVAYPNQVKTAIREALREASIADTAGAKPTEEELLALHDAEWQKFRANESGTPAFRVQFARAVLAKFGVRSEPSSDTAGAKPIGYASRKHLEQIDERHPALIYPTAEDEWTVPVFAAPPALSSDTDGTVYQYTEYPNDGIWRDCSKSEYDRTNPKWRRIVFATPPAPSVADAATAIEAPAQADLPCPTCGGEVAKRFNSLKDDNSQAVALSDKQLAALRALVEMCQVHGDFSNGVTDPTGAIDEGMVRAGEIIDEAAQALSAIDAALSAPASMSAEPECTCSSNPHLASCPVTAHVRNMFAQSGECAQGVATPSAENRPAQDDVRDAERYRWLRSAPFNAAMPVMFDYDGPTPNPGWRRASVLLDNAIDAAIASQSAKEGA